MRKKYHIFRRFVDLKNKRSDTMLARALPVFKPAVRRMSMAVRQFSTPVRETPTAVKMRNNAMALGLLGFCAGIYYTAISKMKQEDDDLEAMMKE